jgi:hypothetical protein
MTHVLEDRRRGARAHAPALLATLLIAAALLVTGEEVAALLAALGVSALLPFAQELFAGPAGGGGDKVVHAVLFLVHASTLVRSFEAGSFAARTEAPARQGTRALWLAAGLSLLYGGVLEWLQGVIGRDADPWDLLADGVGIGLCVAWRLGRRWWRGAAERHS